MKQRLPMTTRRILLYGAVAVFLVLAGAYAVWISQPLPGAPSAPQATQVVNTESGGLGVTREEWETAHGAGKQDPVGYAYSSGEVVAFQSDLKGASSIAMIEKQWTAPPTLAEVRRDTRNLLPKDTTYIETQNVREATIVDVYTSNWLKGRFGKNIFIGAEPGTFIVLYKLSGDDRVSRIVIAPGNNP